MPVTLNPYINLHGQARQALAYYQTIFGGTVTSSSYAEAGVSHPDTDPDNLMHGQLAGDNGILFMVSDALGNNDQPLTSDIQMSLSGDDEVLLRGYYEKLAVDGTITIPLDKAPWGDTFGMLTDRFGVNWMVNVSAQVR